MEPRRPARRKATRVLIITAVAIVVLVAGAGVWVARYGLPGQDEASGQELARTASASLETLQTTVETTGSVSPGINETVGFEVSGTVTEVLVGVGEVVTEGTHLATVDTLQLDAAVLSARADLAEARAALASAEEANDGSEATQAREDAAAAAVTVAETAVTQAEQALDSAVLTAPVSGQVVSVGIEVGDKVTGSGSSASAGDSGGTSGGAPDSTNASAQTTSTSAAFTLVSTDTWNVTASVGESDIDAVAAGQQVELTSDSDETYFGVVEQVAILPSTTSGSPQYPVTISITGDGAGLHDGISLTTSIVIERRLDVLTVPAAAISSSEEGSSVQLVNEDGSTTQVQVETGQTNGDLTEIISGLAEGDEVELTVFTPGEGNQDQDSSRDRGFPGDGEGMQPPTGTDGGMQPPGGGFQGGQGGDQ